MREFAINKKIIIEFDQLCNSSKVSRLIRATCCLKLPHKPNVAHEH